MKNWKKEFDEINFLRQYMYPHPSERIIGFMAGNNSKNINYKLVEKYKKQALKPIKCFIEELLAKQKEELIKQLKEGKICTNCGIEKENNHTDWCEECLESC
jgi:F420-0:gamma-glutamyl ligase